MNHTYPDCKYNAGVGCEPNHRHCQKCGWNPDVAKVRLRARGIYQSVSELPQIGNRIDTVLGVQDRDTVHLYRWTGNKWELKKK